MKVDFVESPRTECPTSYEEHLENLMQRRLGNRIRNLEVRVTEGGLILRGRVATYHAKQLAQHAIMELCDRSILTNDIEVC